MAPDSQCRWSKQFNNIGAPLVPHTILQQPVVRGREEGCRESRTSCQDGHDFWRCLDASTMLDTGSSCYCAPHCSKCFLTSAYRLVSLMLNFSCLPSNSAYLLQLCLSLVWSPREQMECADGIIRDVEGFEQHQEPEICQLFIYKRVAAPRWTWSISIRGLMIWISKWLLRFLWYLFPAAAHYVTWPYHMYMSNRLSTNRCNARQVCRTFLLPGPLLFNIQTFSLCCGLYACKWFLCFLQFVLYEARNASKLTFTVRHGPFWPVLIWLTLVFLI